MKKILAFAGSNSKKSINKELASFAANQIRGAEIFVLDLNEFELPMFSVDYENDEGIPSTAQRFLDEIKSADGIVLSLAEHNGAYAAIFKNLLDWMSRIEGKVWNNKPMLLMATSPGGRGGASVLEIAAGKFPRMGAQITDVFSLPSFNDNFSENGIVDETLRESFNSVIENFAESI
jgi:NAD(P)H-dependent FMN reductase